MPGSRRQLTVLCAVVLVVSGCGRAELVGLSVVVAPTPFVSDGLTRVAYELHVAVPADAPRALRITSVEVLADSRPEPVATFAGEELAAAIAHPGRRAKEVPPTEVAPGQTAVVRAWITLPDATVPGTLRHRVTVQQDAGTTRLEGGPTSLKSQLTVIASPLREGLWLVHEGPGNPRSHHWAPLETSGRVRVPQRYALDLIGVDRAGRAVRDGGRQSRNEDWTGYGVEVIAVADGIVREAQDNQPDREALAPLPPIEAPSLQAVAGNYVIQDVGDGRLVVYAHLQPHSVAVRAGERVQRGQVLGRVGSSGNSNAPHLHFQLYDNVTLEAAEGLPYVFESFESHGRNSAERAILGPPSAPAPAGRRRRELPLDGSVIGFSATPR